MAPLFQRTGALPPHRGVRKLHHHLQAGRVAQLAGAVAACVGGALVLAEVDIARAHLHARAVAGFDEPAPAQRDHPLRVRAFVPVADPAHRQHRELHTHHLAGKRPQPLRRGATAYALALEAGQLRGVEPAQPVRPGPQVQERQAGRQGLIGTVVMQRDLRGQGRGGQQGGRHAVTSCENRSAAWRLSGRCLRGVKGRTGAQGDCGRVHARCWQVRVALLTMAMTSARHALARSSGRRVGRERSFSCTVWRVSARGTSCDCRRVSLSIHRRLAFQEFRQWQLSSVAAKQRCPPEQRRPGRVCNTAPHPLE